MTNTQSVNHQIATVGWSALLVWWGISLMVGPITIGMSAVGTGLILFGVNAARSRYAIPPNPANYSVGIIALVWGILDHVFALRFESSLAVLLILIGIVTLGTLLAGRQRCA